MPSKHRPDDLCNGVALIPDALTLSPAEVSALALSVKVAFWATILSLPAGISAAWLLARGRFPGKKLFDALVHLPLVLPPVVPGYLLLLLFGRQGVIGHWLAETLNISLAFSWKGAALASATMAFPLLITPIRLSMEAIDRRIEQAAASLGAAPWRVFWSITLPLSLPGVFSGVLLSFSRSLGEFGATMAFVGNIPGETRTLPLAIYSAMHTPEGEPAAMRLIALSLFIALCALLANDCVAQRLRRRTQ